MGTTATHNYNIFLGLGFSHFVNLLIYSVVTSLASSSLYFIIFS